MFRKSLLASSALLALVGMSSTALANTATGNTFSVTVVNHNAEEKIEVLGARDTKSYLWNHGMQGDIKTDGNLFSDKKLLISAGQPASGTFTIPEGSQLAVYLNIKTAATHKLTSWGHGCRIAMEVGTDGKPKPAAEHASGFGWASGKMCKSIQVSQADNGWVIDVTTPVATKRG